MQNKLFTYFFFSNKDKILKHHCCAFKERSKIGLFLYASLQKSKLFHFISSLAIMTKFILLPTPQSCVSLGVDPGAKESLHMLATTFGQTDTSQISSFYQSTRCNRPMHWSILDWSVDPEIKASRIRYHKYKLH